MLFVLSARNMKRVIKKVAVLGSGVMGSRIACHFAGIGVQVLLLDIASPNPTQGMEQKPSAKNKIVNDALTSEEGVSEAKFVSGKAQQSKHENAFNSRRY